MTKAIGDIKEKHNLPWRSSQNMHRKRSQLKCQQNLKAQNIALDSGGFKNIVKEGTVFIMDPKQ